MTSIDSAQMPDGRRLDVRVSGPDDGLPLIYLHGTPGAATPLRFLERAVHERGLRLITTGRPGYGDSTSQPGRSVVDVVADVSTVLQSLDAERCLVAGWSGGGPHALACAARLEQVGAVLVVAGVAPFDAEGLDWMAGMVEENVTEMTNAIAGEDALRRYLDGVREHLADISPASIITALKSLLPAADLAVLTDEFGEDMSTSFREALRNGVEGCLEDDLAFVKPWGFHLDEIAVPTMLWQGSLDLMVPFAHGEWLASHLSGASVHLEQGEGHLSIGIGALDRMLDELLAHAGTS